MHLRSLLLRVTIVTTLIVFGVLANAVAARLNPGDRAVNSRGASLVLIPLVALPLLPSLLSP